MRRTPRLLILSTSLLFVGLLTLQACTTPVPTAAPADEASATPSTPLGEFHSDYSVREVMTNIIDPSADFVWDATSYEITSKGAVEIVPTTDEDWATVLRGAVSMVEGSNLLKIRRRVAPAHDNVSKNPGELHPEEVEALIAKSPGVWNGYVEGLRTKGLEIAKIVEARDVAKLTQAGTELDQVCESCHLNFWYPGDREAVERDKNSKIIPPRATP